MTDFLNGKTAIHMIGIGGSGMYPLAQILHSKGYQLTGSDNNETATLQAVRSLGIPVFLGHAAENVQSADLVIYSAAIMADNPELIAAKENGIETRERSELLGLVTEWYNKAVCVSGTHGKTTTSSMLTHMFLAEGIDLSAVIGGKLRAIDGSGRVGKSQHMVCEACEFNDTFLQLSPNISVVLNIDEDHLEYFKTLQNLRASFTKFINRTTDILVYNGDDENTVLAVEDSQFSGKKITFGWGKSNDFYPDKIRRISPFHTEFGLFQSGICLTTISIFVPGRHNILNAAAAAAAAIAAGCSIRALHDGLKTFQGAARRFERLYDENGITVVDDYAHHPAEVEATLKTAKQMGYKRVIVIHQPFTFSRTARLLDDFAEALKLADMVILTQIMGSREKNTYNIYSQDLAYEIGDAKVYDTFEEIADTVAAEAEAGDLIITLGCGDVYKIADLLVSRLRAKTE